MRRFSVGFRDVVSGKQVDIYRDKMGRLWLAGSPWALFRASRMSDLWPVTRHPTKRAAASQAAEGEKG